MASCFLAPISCSNFGVFTSKQCLRHFQAFPRRPCIRSTLYHCDQVCGGIQPMQTYTRASEERRVLRFFCPAKKKSIPHLCFPSNYTVHHPSSQQRISIPWDAGAPHYDPLGVVLLVLVMLLVLMLLPRVRAQRHVRHVAQSVVVDTVLGLRRRRAVVA